MAGHEGRQGEGHSSHICRVRQTLKFCRMFAKVARIHGNPDRRRLPCPASSGIRQERHITKPSSVSPSPHSNQRSEKEREDGS